MNEFAGECVQTNDVLDNALLVKGRSDRQSSLPGNIFAFIAGCLLYDTILLKASLLQSIAFFCVGRIY